MTESKFDDGKVVRMPKAEEMITKLEGTGLYGITPQTDRFYDRFVEQVADSEKVGMGLNMAWELAQYDTLRGYPPVMRSLINLGFDRVIDAVTPDTVVATEAKNFRRKIMEEAKRAQGRQPGK